MGGEFVYNKGIKGSRKLDSNEVWLESIKS